MAGQVVISILGAVLALCPNMVPAQGQEIESSFQRVSPEEEKRLRSILAAPEPVGVAARQLERHFNAKEAAANRLGEPGVAEQVLRRAVERLTYAYLRNNLGRRLIEAGKLDEGKAMRQEAFDKADAVGKLFYAANIACDIFFQNKLRLAGDAIERNLRELDGIAAGEAATAPAKARVVARAYARNYACRSNVDQRRGRFESAIEAAVEAEKHARRALAVFPAGEAARTRRFAIDDMTEALACKLRSFHAAGRLYDAERVLGDYLRIAREETLPSSYLFGLNKLASEIRLQQREFVHAEALIRRADSVLTKLGWGALEGSRPSAAVSLIAALAGQGRWADALQQLQQLDQLAGADERRRRQVRFTYERG